MNGQSASIQKAVVMQHCSIHFCGLRQQETNCYQHIHLLCSLTFQLGHDTTAILARGLDMWTAELMTASCLLLVGQ